MDRFRTVLSPGPYPFSISYQDRILSLGSCFAGHIGQRLERYKFNSLLNPFGILYNPVSLAEALDRLAEGALFREEDLFEHQGLWHSFAHHGHFSGPDRAETLRGINQTLARGGDFLKSTNRLVLTLGTAHVFVYRKTGRIVANCHKLPGGLFDRRRLSVSEILESLAPVLAHLSSRHPELQVVMTVSPVRHIRDGLVENQRSKAALLLAIDELSDRFPFVHYFPAYELLLDDLRDYRFYAADLIHPNEQAIDYIWDLFVQAFLDGPARDLLPAVAAVVRAAEHRPFRPDTEAFRQFVQQQLEKIKSFEQKFGFLNFEREKSLLRSWFE